MDRLPTKEPQRTYCRCGKIKKNGDSKQVADVIIIDSGMVVCEEANANLSIVHNRSFQGTELGLLDAKGSMELPAETFGRKQKDGKGAMFSFSLPFA